ncbi:hypothetical protein L218DRAFT_943885 [Marasmius fiardii PR-910]|nr:hypothetical protein L218DRAFT_943885 [Marasmius fiardii PR-910]
MARVANSLLSRSSCLQDLHMLHPRETLHHRAGYRRRVSRLRSSDQNYLPGPSPVIFRSYILSGIEENRKCSPPCKVMISTFLEHNFMGYPVQARVSHSDRYSLPEFLASLRSAKYDVIAFGPVISVLEDVMGEETINGRYCSLCLSISTKVNGDSTVWKAGLTRFSRVSPATGKPSTHQGPRIPGMLVRFTAVCKNKPRQAGSDVRSIGCPYACLFPPVSLDIELPNAAVTHKILPPHYNDSNYIHPTSLCPLMPTGMIKISMSAHLSQIHNTFLIPEEADPEGNIDSRETVDVLQALGTRWLELAFKLHSDGKAVWKNELEYGRSGPEMVGVNRVRNWKKLSKASLTFPSPNNGLTVIIINKVSSWGRPHPSVVSYHQTIYSGNKGEERMNWNNIYRPYRFSISNHMSKNEE